MPPTSSKSTNTNTTTTKYSSSNFKRTWSLIFIYLLLTSSFTVTIRATSVVGRFTQPTPPSLRNNAGIATGNPGSSNAGGSASGSSNTQPALTPSQSIPPGYNAAVDTTGAYVVLWRLSRGMRDGPGTFTLDAMVFLSNAFRGGRLPQLNERIQIRAADVTYKYVRRVTNATHLSLEGFLANSSSVEDPLETNATHPHLVMNVQRTIAMTSVSPVAFQVPVLQLPKEVTAVQFLFSMQLLVRSNDAISGTNPNIPPGLRLVPITTFQWGVQILSLVLTRFDEGVTATGNAISSAEMDGYFDLPINPDENEAGDLYPASPIQDEGDFVHQVYIHGPVATFYARETFQATANSQAFFSPSLARAGPHLNVSRAVFVPPRRPELQAFVFPHAATNTIGDPTCTIAFWPKRTAFADPSDNNLAMEWVDVQIQLQLIPKHVLSDRDREFIITGAWNQPSPSTDTSSPAFTSIHPDDGSSSSITNTTVGDNLAVVNNNLRLRALSLSSLLHRRAGIRLPRTRRANGARQDNPFSSVRPIKRTTAKVTEAAKPQAQSALESWFAENFGERGRKVYLSRSNLTAESSKARVVKNQAMNRKPSRASPPTKQKSVVVSQVRPSETCLFETAQEVVEPIEEPSNQDNSGTAEAVQNLVDDRPSIWHQILSAMKEIHYEPMLLQTPPLPRKLRRLRTAAEQDVGDRLTHFSRNPQDAQPRKAGTFSQDEPDIARERYKRGRTTKAPKRIRGRSKRKQQRSKVARTTSVDELKRRYHVFPVESQAAGLLGKVFLVFTSEPMVSEAHEPKLQVKHNSLKGAASHHTPAKESPRAIIWPKDVPLPKAGPAGYFQNLTKDQTDKVVDIWTATLLDDLKQRRKNDNEPLAEAKRAPKTRSSKVAASRPAAAQDEFRHFFPSQQEIDWHRGETQRRLVRTQRQLTPVNREIQTMMSSLLAMSADHASEKSSGGVSHKLWRALYTLNILADRQLRSTPGRAKRHTYVLSEEERRAQIRFRDAKHMRRTWRLLQAVRNTHAMMRDTLRYMDVGKLTRQSTPMLVDGFGVHSLPPRLGTSTELIRIGTQAMKAPSKSPVLTRRMRLHAIEPMNSVAPNPNDLVIGPWFDGDGLVDNPNSQQTGNSEFDGTLVDGPWFNGDGLVEEVTGESQQVEQPPADSTLPEDDSSNQGPVEQPPVEQPPSHPMEEQSPSSPEEPSPEQPPGENDMRQQPPAEQPPVEQLPPEQPPSEQPPSEQPPSEQPPSEQPPIEEPPMEQPSIERPQEEQPAAEHPLEDQPSTDSPSDSPIDVSSPSEDQAPPPTSPSGNAEDPLPSDASEPAPITPVPSDVEVPPTTPEVPDLPALPDIPGIPSPPTFNPLPPSDPTTSPTIPLPNLPTNGSLSDIPVIGDIIDAILGNDSDDGQSNSTTNSTAGPSPVGNVTNTNATVTLNTVVNNTLPNVATLRVDRSLPIKRFMMAQAQPVNSGTTSSGNGASVPPVTPPSFLDLHIVVLRQPDPSRASVPFAAKERTFHVAGSSDDVREGNSSSQAEDADEEYEVHLLSEGLDLDDPELISELELAIDQFASDPSGEFNARIPSSSSSHTTHRTSDPQAAHAASRPVRPLGTDSSSTSSSLQAQLTSPELAELARSPDYMVVVFYQFIYQPPRSSNSMSAVPAVLAPWRHFILPLPPVEMTRPASSLPQSTLTRAPTPIDTEPPLPTLVPRGPGLWELELPTVADNTRPPPRPRPPSPPRNRTSPSQPSQPGGSDTPPTPGGSSDSASPSPTNTTSGTVPTSNTTVPTGSSDENVLLNVLGTPLEASPFVSVGWNLTWFLTEYKPDSPYLYRHDVIPSIMDPAAHPEELSALNVEAPNLLAQTQRSMLYHVTFIPGFLIEETAEFLDAKITMWINRELIGEYSMKRLDASPGNRQSPLGYYHPYLGVRYVSPAVLLYPNDILAYSFEFRIRPLPQMTPANRTRVWSEGDVWGVRRVRTPSFPWPGPRSFVQGVAPLSTVSPDPAELRTAPTYQVVVKVRPGIPAKRMSLHFVRGRKSAENGGLLGLPPIDSWICHVAETPVVTGPAVPDQIDEGEESSGYTIYDKLAQLTVQKPQEQRPTAVAKLPLRSMHNIWMRKILLPMVIFSEIPLAASNAVVSTQPVHMQSLVPVEFGGSLRSPIADVSRSFILAVVEHSLEFLPYILEEWWYFDGLANSSVLAVFEAGTTDAFSRRTPFPDPDPGLPLRAAPDEDILLYSITVWPKNEPEREFISPTLIYSPDSYPTTGKALGFLQTYPAVHRCF